MKDNNTDIDRILFETDRAYANIAEGLSTSFSDLARALSLTPENDFRNSDLSSVDFSNSDLRGFNFTGSDLRGAYGINVRFDNSTIFHEAQADNSIFQSAIERDAFFSDPENEREYDLLKNSYWTDAILYVAKNLTGKKKPTERSVRLSERLFFETQDAVVRSDVLLCLRSTKYSNDEYFSFLLEVIARMGSDLQIARAIARILAEVFFNRKQAAEILSKYLDNPDVILRKYAVVGIANSQYFRTHVGKIVENLRPKTNENQYIRRTLLSLVAKRRSHYHYLCVKEPHTNTVLDYEEPLNSNLIYFIAREIIKTFAQANSYGKMAEPKYKDIQREMIVVIKSIGEIICDGIPFKVSKLK